jgi:hypothetical protein
MEKQRAREEALLKERERKAAEYAQLRLEREAKYDSSEYVGLNVLIDMYGRNPLRERPPDDSSFHDKACAVNSVGSLIRQNLRQRNAAVDTE